MAMTADNSRQQAHLVAEIIRDSTTDGRDQVAPHRIMSEIALAHRALQEEHDEAGEDSQGKEVEYGFHRGSAIRTIANFAIRPTGQLLRLWRERVASGGANECSIRPCQSQGSSWPRYLAQAPRRRCCR